MMDRKSEYSELLRDPRWQKLRLQVFERDGWSCRFCGDKETTLAVHHLVYISGRKPWEYDLAQLLTVCEACHEHEYNFRSDYEHDLLHTLRMIGSSADQLSQFLQALHSHRESPYRPLIIESLFFALVDHKLMYELVRIVASNFVDSPHRLLSDLSRRFLEEKDTQKPQDER